MCSFRCHSDSFSRLAPLFHKAQFPKSCQSESGIVGSVQPRPQAISRYPSERRRHRTERDCAGNDRERGYVHPRRPRGSQSGREKRCDKSFQAQAEKPLGTDSHRTISKRSSECFVLLCPIGEQHLLSSFREFVHDGY